MQRDTEGQRYSPVARAFHWLMALGILAQFPLVLYMDALPLGPAKFEYFNLHKSLGLLLLLLAILRLAWRHISPPPPLPDSTPPLVAFAAHAGHLFLYVFIFAQPLLGLIGSMASGYPTLIFWSFNLPHLLPTNQTVTDVSFFIHHWLGWGALAVIAGHAGAALFHHYVWKDDTLKRMLPGGSK
ncbi:cytochrome b [Rhodovibrionaceae bacterium A322]